MLQRRNDEKERQCPDAVSPFTITHLGVHWKDWCWSWNSSTLATSCEGLTHWKRPWCWEGLGAGGEGEDRGWDGWMASPTWWAWVWVNSGSWWWTGRPGVLRVMGSQSWTWLSDWTELNWIISLVYILVLHTRICKRAGQGEDYVERAPSNKPITSL